MTPTNLIVILSDELWGVHAKPAPLVVVGANLAWLVMPFVVGWRVLRSPHPFTEGTTTDSDGDSTGSVTGKRSRR